MKSDKLSELIKKEKENLQKLKSRRAGLDEKIKKSEAKLQEYEMMNNNQMFGAMSSIVKKSGLSMNDVLVALQSGDLVSLQEQMEAAQENESEDKEDNTSQTQQENA